ASTRPNGRLRERRSVSFYEGMEHPARKDVDGDCGRWVRGLWSCATRLGGAGGILLHFSFCPASTPGDYVTAWRFAPLRPPWHHPAGARPEPQGERLTVRKYTITAAGRQDRPGKR